MNINKQEYDSFFEDKELEFQDPEKEEAPIVRIAKLYEYFTFPKAKDEIRTWLLEMEIRLPITMSIKRLGRLVANKLNIPKHLRLKHYYELIQSIFLDAVQVEILGNEWLAKERRFKIMSLKKEWFEE